MKPNPAYIETRSMRVQLLMQPSLHARLKETARAQDVSLNDLIHQVMEEYTVKSVKTKIAIFTHISVCIYKYINKRDRWHSRLIKGAALV